MAGCCLGSSSAFRRGLALPLVLERLDTRAILQSIAELGKLQSLLPGYQRSTLSLRAAVWTKEFKKFTYACFTCVR
jgi:hypothetical protein